MANDAWWAALPAAPKAEIQQAIGRGLVRRVATADGREFLVWARPPAVLPATPEAALAELRRQLEHP